MNNDMFQIEFIPWVHEWRRYLYSREAALPEMLENLRSGLDEEGQETVDKTFERFMHIFPAPEVHENMPFLVPLHSYFTPGEIQRMDGFEDAYLIARRKVEEKYPHSKSLYHGKMIMTLKSGTTLFPEKTRNALEGRAIIDGGACWGDSMIAFDSYKPSKTFCFEPDEKNYGDLITTISHGNFNHVTPIKKALSDQCGETTFYTQQYPGSNMGASLKQTHSAVHPVQVAISTIDDEISSHEDIGLIKLDVEGYELEALHGAEKTIRRCKPALVVALYHTAKDFFEVKPYLESLNLGYNFYIRKLVRTSSVYGLYLLAF